MFGILKRFETLSSARDCPFIGSTSTPLLWSNLERITTTTMTMFWLQFSNFCPSLICLTSSKIYFGTQWLKMRRVKTHSTTNLKPVSCSLSLPAPWRNNSPILSLYYNAIPKKSHFILYSFRFFGRNPMCRHNSVISTWIWSWGRLWIMWRLENLSIWC